MKRFIYTLTALFCFSIIGNAQADKYDLKSQNLHKKVRKTLTHYYAYDKKSGGFVKKSVNIKNYNDDGNLVETYYLYNSKYSTPNATKKLYNYNSENQLISTQDISDVIGKYSTHLRFHYNNKGNLTKQESISKSGNTYTTKYRYNNKNRLIKIEAFNNKMVMTSETDISYNGKKRTEKMISYSSKDGSVNGEYTTFYNDDVKTSYTSKGKFSNYNNTYEYDKKGNLKKNNSRGKKTYVYSYDYEYDKKDNWIKKHYRSGKNQYFYFREIIFKNGKTSGSTDFDRNFINKYGNFENVAVVPLKKNKK